MSTSRRAARGQSLPPDTVQRLREILPHSTVFYAEVTSLFEAGWTLRAIGEAFEPPVTRSTVHAWIAQAPPTPPTLIPSPDLPLPTPRTPAVYVRKTPPPPPPILAHEADRLANLAPEAQKFRSGMHPSSAPALANDEMTALVHLLHDPPNGHTIAQIAHAAHVSPRAIRKRLNK